MISADRERRSSGGDRVPLWAVVGTLNGAPLFMGATIVYIPYLLSGWHLARSLPARVAGGFLILAAAPVILDFLVRFVREGHGTPIPVAPPQRLVVRGAFRYVRNPAYLAAVTAMMGQGLLFGSPAVLVYSAVMAVLFHLFVVGYEEPTLVRKFGTDYEAYRRAVPRWIPRLGSRRP